MNAILIKTALVACATIALQISTATAQGPLAPPGPPAPLFKTLEQIEPRRPISSLPFTINQSGSYYLTTNLIGVAGQHGITVNGGDGVTIDLMGFEVRGIAGSLSGVFLNGGLRVYIYNGVIRNWGQDGINGNGAAASILERLRVANNSRHGITINSGSHVRECISSGNGQVGILTSNHVEVDDCIAGGNGTHGIQCGTGSNVRRCLTTGNVGSGITGSGLDGFNILDCNSEVNGGGINIIGQAIVRNSFSRSNRLSGITVGDGSSVTGCNASDTGTAATPTAHGIQVGGGSTVRDCTTRNNGGDGINATFGCTVVNNTCRDNLGDNIEVSQECLVTGNACDDNVVGTSQSGVRVSSNNNRIENNTLTENLRGLWVVSSGNVVVNNTVIRNSTNYVVVNGNQLNLSLGQLPETIPWPAVVKLAGSLGGLPGQNGITIASDDVTIDLDGHSLIGSGTSLDGILVSGIRTNIVVRNGALRRWGQDGVDANTAVNSSITDINVSANTGRGIVLGAGGVVKDSNARANGGIGIVISTGSRVLDSSSSENGGIGIDMNTGSTAVGCTAFNNGGIGIDASTSCTVSRCTSYSNTGFGINANAATTVDNCAVSSNSTNGIVGSNGAKITGCAVRANAGNGIVVSSDAYVFNNQVDEHFGDAGILVTGSDNRIDSNNCSDSTRGIDVDAAGNLVVRNSVSGATTAYDIVAGNSVGPVIGVANPIASTNPWANFSF